MKKQTKKAVTNSSPKTEGLPDGIKGSGDGSRYHVLHRSKFKNAPYNPQQSDPVTQKKLRESIKLTGGLIEAPIWNLRTGNIVGGHKRIAQEDILKGHADYTMVASVIDVPLEREIEINIALNNEALKGTWDIEKLDELLSMPDVDLSHTGFDFSSLELLHMDRGVDLPAFMVDPLEAQSLPEIEEMVEDIESAADDAEEADYDEAQEEEISEIKERKKEFAERQDFLRQGKVFARVIFPSDASKELFMNHLELSPDAEYIDGMAILRALGLETDALEAIEEEKPKRMKEVEARKNSKQKEKENGTPSDSKSKRNSGKSTNGKPAKA